MNLIGKCVTQYFVKSKKTLTSHLTKGSRSAILDLPKRDNVKYIRTSNSHEERFNVVETNCGTINSIPMVAVLIWYERKN